MNTAKMNSILGRISKGVGNSKILPITEYLKIELKDKVLTITATDSANFIEHVEHDIEGENGVAIVKADKLIKLVAKTTEKEVSFELKDTFLQVKGNGTYKVEIFDTDEYPSYEFNTDVKGVAVKTATLKKVFNTNKSAIATDMLMPCLTGYNLGDTAITTDGSKMCLNEVSIFPEERALIPQKLADLISVLNTEEVYVQKDGNKLLFSTEGTTIFGTELDGIENYPDVSPVTNIPFQNHAVIKRQQLLDALDRLSLFVDNDTSYAVWIEFLEDALYVSDYKKKSTEKIDYIDKAQNEKDIRMTFNLVYLKDLVSALNKDNAEIYYSEGLPLKLKEDNVTLILSSMKE